MPKNYTDFVDTMADVRRHGFTVDTLVLTTASVENFFTDGKFTEDIEEKQEDLGEFEVPITEGDGNYILTESGETFAL